jgi:DNA repair exonuclease SbcCD ATPase subunit
MLLKLDLKNFQAHQNLSIDLTSGLQAIRGANERGKSTIYRAIAYAWFGSRALPLSLEETVTWGFPASSLQVVLRFSVGTSTYTITRRKAGAELVGEGVTASGHAEVTAFVERLLGAPAKLVQATLLANQGSLKDGLDSSATPLIEKLANLDLFDTLIGKIQSDHPSGNTKALEAQVQAAASLTAPTLNTGAEEEKIRLAQAELDSQQAKVLETEAALAAVKAKADLAAQKAERNERIKGQVSSLKTLLGKAQANSVTPVPPPVVDTIALKAHAEIMAFNVRHDSALNLLQSYPAADVRYRVRTEFLEEETNLRKQLKDLQAQFRQLELARASTESRKITQTACGLCGKDLNNVPEVVSANAALSAEVERLTAELAKLDTQREALSASLATCDVITNIDKARQAYGVRFSGLLDLIEVEVDSVIPRVARITTSRKIYTYAGDAAADLAKVERAQSLYAQQMEIYRATSETVKDTQAAIAEAEAKLEELTVEDLQSVRELAVLKDLRSVQARQLTTLQQTLQQAVSDLEKSKAVFAAQTQAYESALATKAKLESLLQLTYKNNTVLSKLREVRPAVSRQLWQLVLGGISQYFSTIRGQISVVTRDESGFLIDGKKIAAYSGSTQDALGLAIRLTLMKTFLPNADFLLVDEPGAACDPTREAAMISLLPNCGLAQVLLVTHSELADAYAVNVIQI